MTALLTRPETPSGRGGIPGWDIVADMTPRELVNSRWIAVLQRRIAAGLLLVIVLCAVGFAHASLLNRAATEQEETAAARTIYLRRSAAQYEGITRIETTVSDLNSQLTSLMANEVNVARIIASIRRSLPRSMSITSISVSLDASGGVDSSDVLDGSGRPTIGTVNISGSGRALDDLPAFVDGLSAVPGFGDVVPTSNQVSDGKAQFSTVVTLTDQLYSHWYDATKAGDK